MHPNDKELERISKERLEIESTVAEIRKESRRIQALCSSMIEAIEEEAVAKEAQGEDAVCLRAKLNGLRQKHAELLLSFEPHVSSGTNAEAVWPIESSHQIAPCP